MSREHRGVRGWHVLAIAFCLCAAACGGIIAVDGRQLDTSDAGTSQQDGGTTDGPAGDGPTGDGPSSRQSDTGTENAVSCDGPCVLATRLDYPFEITSDDTNVYWTEFGENQGTGNGSVKGCPLAGCGSALIVYATALTNPRGIASDGTNVYFGTASYMAVTGAIWSCPVAGCNGSPTKLSDAVVPYGITVDSSRVYWADFDDSTVHSVPKTGAGGSALLYDGGAMAFENEEVVADGAFLYFTDLYGDVYKLPIGGGDPVLMATWTGLGGWPVRVDSTWVYFGQSGGVSVMSKDATNGGAFIVSNLKDPLGIALDPPTGRLYWADYGSGAGDDGKIGRVSTDGGGGMLIASSQINVEDLTVAGDYVFWISSGVMTDNGGAPLPSSGALFRMPK